jgi:hypothetical protein
VAKDLNMAVNEATIEATDLNMCAVLDHGIKRLFFPSFRPSIVAM